MTDIGEPVPHKRSDDPDPTPPFLHRRTEDIVPKTPPVPALTDKAVNTAKELKQQLRVLIALTVLLYVAFGLLVWFTWGQSNTNTKGLCAIRKEAETRVSEGQGFLKAHQNGAFGLTKAQLQTSIDQAQATATALSVVAC